MLSTPECARVAEYLRERREWAAGRGEATPGVTASQVFEFGLEADEAARPPRPGVLPGAATAEDVRGLLDAMVDRGLVRCRDVVRPAGSGDRTRTSRYFFATLKLMLAAGCEQGAAAP